MATTTTTTSSSSSPPSSTLHLHTYFRSSCSARLRIALRLKRLPHTTTPVHLLRREQTLPAYKSLNPSGTVPTLTHTIVNHSPPTAQPPKTVTITQSTAALEYLDEAFPDAGPALFSGGEEGDAESRAHVRTLVAMVACDTQPLTNSAAIKAVEGLGGDGREWARAWTVRGLDAVEAYLGRTMVGGEEGGARWCVGRGVSAADVCLVPAVWAAQRWECDLERWPRIMSVFRHMETLEEVKAAHWRRQEDTPEEFREA
ncbi:maleylacetoacetate isomerase [Diplodia corticola]|uniref:Maleylacetoacetate isomerase n=1 Tax=Diplodia corticola TaxID=236234 RepID=A0A1J9QTK8_9PEZI|nr:maleylacetoacetate isomerase [Diplodia corticola]OJD31729.1 maleylacetoacetate isomerase [Diplodia corticola]